MKIGEIIIKKMVSPKIWEISEFRKRNIRERTLGDEYVYGITRKYLEKRMSFAISNIQRLSPYSRGFRDLQSLSDFGRWKGVLWSFFASLKKNLTKIFITPPKLHDLYRSKFFVQT